jgi:hypothetical protein
MDRGGAQGSAGEPAEGAERRQDPIVERLRPDPAQQPEPTVTMAGFRGDSDRPGFRRLYFTRGLDYYAEFRDEDVIGISAIPAEVAPFPGEEATRVTLRRDAQVAFTRTRTAGPPDDFDLDIRIGPRRGGFPKVEVTDADTVYDCDCIHRVIPFQSQIVGADCPREFPPPVSDFICKPETPIRFETPGPRF